MQRFLTESPWDDDTVIGRLQEYLGPRLGHPEGVWVLDGSDFPKQGVKSVGVARQYCGRLGKVANCQAGMFLAYVSPLGRALVDKRLYLPESWTADTDRCQAAGGPGERQGYRSKTGLALEMLQRALERGHLQAGWVAGYDAFGMSPSFREGLAALGMRYVLDVPAGFTVWPEELERTRPAYQGRGAPRKPRLVGGQRRTMGERAAAIPEAAWREIAVAEGSQSPRRYRFSTQRVRPTSRRKPGEIHWAVYRRNLDGSEPRYYLSNAPEDTLTGVGIGFLRWDMASNLQVELGFWPGFGQQPDAAPEAALEQQAPEPVDAVADHAHGARRTAPRVTVIGSQCFGRRPQVAWSNPPLLGVLHPGAIGQGQQGGHRQDEPVPGDAGGVGAPRLVPLPAQALEGLEAQLDPEAQGVPAGTHLIGCKVGEDDPGFLLFGVPDHQQGAAALGLGGAEGGAAANPRRIGDGRRSAGRAIVCRRQRRK